MAYFVPALIFGLFMAGCGSPTGGGRNNTGNPATTPPTMPPTTSATAPTATVRGQVLRPPGPDPRSGGATGSVPVNGDPVHAADPSGRVVATTVTASDGHFELTLPPGTYQITEDTCGTSQQLEIRSATTTSLNISISNAC
jgi:hypothetical protein